MEDQIAPISLENYEDNLYFMSHWRNAEPILKEGILCKSLMMQEARGHVSIASEAVQDLRRKIFVQRQQEQVRRALHDYVPLYFCAPTAMIFQLRKIQDEIVYFEVDSQVLTLPGVLVSDGNAAIQGASAVRVREVTVEVIEDDQPRISSRVYSPQVITLVTQKPLTSFFAGPKALDRLPWQVLERTDWGKRNSGWTEEVKRQRQAEALIPRRVDPMYIVGMHVRTQNLRMKLKELLLPLFPDLDICVTPSLYAG